MPKLQTYTCGACNKEYEFLHHPQDEPATCPNCGSHDAQLRIGGAPLLTAIIPTYPGCKRVKAGYVHSHGDRPAEKGAVSVPSTFKGGSS